jgi:Tfp pilus assembly protein PilO
MNRTLIILQQEYRKKLWLIFQDRIKKPVFQVSLALVGTLLLITLLGILVLRPTLLTISSLIKEIRDEENLVQSLNIKIQALQTVQRSLQELEPQLVLLDAAIPSNREFQIFVKEVELLAGKWALTMIEIHQPGFTIEPDESSQTVAKGTIQTLPVNIRVGGTETAIRGFLADLTRLDRLVILNRVSISSTSIDQSQEQQYSIQGFFDINIIFVSSDL